ncbi:MAG: hypothetical protein RSF81_08530 [Oscillospiraceae bacterium]
MSVVCAKVYKDKIKMAADSIVVRGYSKDTKGDFVKLQKINEMIIGSSGNCDECSIMWQYMKTHKPAKSDERAVLDFIIEFSRWKRDLTGDNSLINAYILAFDGKLFFIQGMFVNEIKDYCAIGAGEDFANAALYLGHTPREAVKVACELSCYVAEPIVEEEITIE